MRLIDFFDRGVALGRERICLEDAVSRRSYGEVQRRSYRMAHAFAREGFGIGQKAGLWSPNCVPGLEAMIGMFRAGMAWVPVNAKNGIEENLYILDHNDVEILFIHSDFAPHFAHIRAACPKILRLVSLDAPAEGAVWLEDWIRDLPESDPDLPLGPEALVGIMSSGGTTGRPKGIIHTQLVWETMIANLFSGIEIGPDPVHLLVTPMTHASGVLAIALLAAGARNLILPGFDAPKILDLMAKEGVTHLFLPPTAIYMLLAHPQLAGRKFPALRGFFYAAAPMATDKLRQCLEIFGPVMIQTFGQAEAPMFCTILTPEDHAVLGDPLLEGRLASCGRPALLTPVGIMDDEGRLLPAGEKGEIVVRGNLVMAGYYKNPEASAEASLHGWHHTGDVGMLDAEGYLYIVDRKKDMIISGGFNIYPSEVEQVIWSHPAVQDCAVVGVPDEKWGEAVKAVLELKPGAKVAEAEIIALCKDRLGPVKAPKSVEIWEQLPRSPVGKVRKKDIRDVFWKGANRRI